MAQERHDSLGDQNAFSGEGAPCTNAVSVLSDRILGAGDPESHYRITQSEQVPAAPSTNLKSKSDAQLELFAEEGSKRRRSESKAIAPASPKSVAANAGNETKKLGKKIMARTPRVSVNNLIALIRSQEFRCALSGRQLTPSNCALDHIRPFSSTRDHSLDNLQFLDEDVNRAKGLLSTEAFVRLCIDVATHFARSSTVIADAPVSHPPLLTERRGQAGTGIGS